LNRLRSRLDWPTVLIIAVTILAAADRIYRLSGRSLWLDETVTAQSAHLNSAADLIAQSQVYVNQAPLFYFVTWGLRAWGDGEFILRLPAAIFGTLAVIAVYLLGRSVFGPRAGVIAALLTAVMPYAVWYSQEARNYTLFMFITAMQIYFTFNAVERSHPLDWLGLALFTTLNLYTHYLALAATAGVVVYVGAFLGVELLRGTGQRAKALAAAVLIVVGVIAAFVLRRAVLKTVFLVAQDILLRAQVHAGYVFASCLGAAIGVGILAFWLRRRSRRVKLAASASLLVALAPMSLITFLGPFRSSQGRVSLPLVALTATIALGLAVAAALLALDLLKHRPSLIHKLEWATVAAALVALAYAPWLPYLRLAISRPDVTVGQLHPTHQPSFNDVVSFLDRLGISGSLLVFFALGLVAIAIWLFRGRTSEAALVLINLLIPVGVLCISAGPAIVDLDIRYLAFLFPTAMLVIAVGVEAISLLVVQVTRRWRPEWRPTYRTAAIPAVLLTALLMGQAIPALAASYQTPKQDYRAAAELIVSSRPAPILLSVGNYSDWSVITFGYYFHELGSPVHVVEGQQVDSVVASTLAASTGIVWGVVIFPSEAQLQLLTSPGAEQVEFVDATRKVYLVRSTDRALSPTRQAIELLRWESLLEPRLRAPMKLLDFLDGHGSSLGPDLLPDPSIGTAGSGGWNLQSGVTVNGDGVAMTTSATNPEVNATYTVPVQQSSDYIVSFDCRNSGLSGWQRVYAMAIDQSGHEVSTLPGGSGFECPHADSGTGSAFAFEAPGGASAVTLIFRVHGSGTADFLMMQLNSISDSP